MRPEEMLQVTLLCRKQDASQVVKILADLKAIHITDHQKESVGNAVIDIGKPFAQAEELSAALVATRNLLSKIPAAESSTPSAESSLQHRVARVREIALRYAEHESISSTLRQELGQVEQQLDLLALLDDEHIESFSARSVETVLLKRNKDAPTINAMRVKQTSPDTFLITVKHGEPTEFPGCERIDLTPIAHLKGSATALRKELRMRHTVILHGIDEQEQMLKSFSEHHQFLAESEPLFTFELLMAQAPLHFGATERITLIRGFIPKREAHKVQERLDGIMTLIDLAEVQDAPVALHNPEPASGFEALIKLYTLPKYHELDPTTLMAFTFPIFFGFMLGDIGYGFSVLTLALILHRYSVTRPFGSILGLSAVATILFGVVYGEFFGAEQVLGFHLSPLLHRVEQFDIMFTIALGIGLFHINLGLILGTINRARAGIMHALAEKGSWLLVELGMLATASALGILNALTIITYDAPWSVAIALLAAGAIGLLWSEEEHGVLKARGIIEMPMMFSNLMSYMRLVAVGLASVYLALVVNSMASGMFDKGGLWLAFGIFVLLLGHALNLALGLLGPFLHSLRLHYVEFFTKFYEGGGKPYRPFGAMEGT
jgi:V/A-type H+-transporting ATPase subunit I